MRTKYYGVFARNGLGIYDDYGKLLIDERFMRGEHLKSFQTEEEAEEFALDGFISLHSDQVYSLNLEKFRVNWFYFCRDLGNVSEGVILE